MYISVCILYICIYIFHLICVNVLSPIVILICWYELICETSKMAGAWAGELGAAAASTAGTTASKCPTGAESNGWSQVCGRFFFRTLQKFIRLGWLEGEDVDYQLLYTGRCFFGMKLMMEWLYSVWRVLGVSHITVFNGLPNRTTGMPTLWRKTMVPIGQYSSLMCCRPMGGKMLVKVVFTMLIFWTWSLIYMHMAALTPIHKRDRWFLHLA